MFARSWNQERQIYIFQGPMAKDMLSVKTVDTVMTDFFMEVTTDLKKFV